MSEKVNLFYHPETGEILNGLARSLLSSDGRKEYPDPTPIAATVEFAPPAVGMRRMVQEMIAREFSELAAAHEMETFADADDFDIEDDPLDPLTPFEMEFDPEVREAVEAEKKRLAAGVPGVPTGSGPTGGAGPEPAPPFSDSGSTDPENPPKPSAAGSQNTPAALGGREGGK